MDPDDGWAPWILGLGVILILSCLVLAPVSTILSGAWARGGMQVAAEPTQVSQVVMSPEELDALLESQARHDERMANKIVATAVSGDIGQIAIVFLLVGLPVAGVVAFLLFMSRPRAGGE